MSILERLGLRRKTPVRLTATVTDPVLGDADHARALLRGEILNGGESFALRGADWDMKRASEAFRSHVHGFIWLRDLAAALPQDKGADFARPIVGGWLERYEEPDEMAWRADRAGARIALWSLYAPYVLGADAGIRKAALKHMLEAAAHIDRRFTSAPAGLPRLAAAAGFVVAALMVEGAERFLKKAEKRFTEAADEAVMPHGLPASRAPADLIAIMEWLHVVRSAYAARRRDWPEAQQAVDGRVRAGLRAARMGDGRFTALHGGNVASFARIEHVLSFPGLASRGAGAGAESGLQRLEAGRTVLLMDAGPPPAPAQNEAAHAGALSFEMSDEHERVVVNVGGGRGIRRGIDARVATAVRVTAAHSTLTLADTNQSLIAAGKPLGAGVDSVEVERDETDQGTLVTAVHDGYQRRFGLMHRRRLFLSPDGRDVRGEDRLMPGGKKRVKAGLEVALRFHLAPGTDITPTADMRGALLRLPSGALWQLKTDAGTVSVDESLWIGEEGRALRTRQIVIADETVPDGWRGRWSFKKMG